MTPQQAKSKLGTVIRIVADFYHVKPSDLIGRHRSAAVAWARQVAEYCAYTISVEPRYIFPFFKRKRSWLNYSVHRVRDTMDCYPKLASEVYGVYRKVQEAVR